MPTGVFSGDVLGAIPQVNMPIGNMLGASHIMKRVRKLKKRKKKAKRKKRRR